jgi:iron complex transport system substrate-binding protein
MARPRIVSLVPSATETLYRLGTGDDLVGRSHGCDYPIEARVLPALTRPRLTTTSSRGIHDEVRARLADGLAIYDIDLEQLRSLEPTHLLVQDQCSVCAVSPADLESALAEWLGAKPALVSIAPHQLGDVWRDIETIGQAIGRSERASSLRRQLAERLSGLVETLSRGSIESGSTAKSSTQTIWRPRVACIEWLDPLMIAGHWIPELVRIAGGDPLFGEVGGASKTIGVSALMAAAPDVLVLQVCGFDLAETERAWAIRGPLRAALDAMSGRRPRVFLTDGDAFFNRPGPRLVESAEILAEILHPTRVDAIHAGTHFREWEPGPVSTRAPIG